MKTDLYQTVTDRIIAALEAGTVPWVRPWTTGTGPALPVNAASRRPYQGINVVLLTLEAGEHGYTRDAWMTYRQAQEFGAQVRPRSCGTTVIFYKQRSVSMGEPTEDADPESSPRSIPVLRAFTVFNVDQIDGLPAELSPTVTTPVWDPLDRAEGLLCASGAEIRLGGPRAYYTPVEDRIQLPERGAFPEASSFYSTAFHELTHWSGHSSRLDRDLRGRFRDHAYAAEELIAEIGAAFLCASLGVQGELQHASYIDNWLQILRGDKRAVFTAAARAQQATRFLLDMEGQSPPSL